MNAVGALAGLGLAIGALLVASAVRRSRPSLVDRVAPWVQTVPSPTGLLARRDPEAGGWLESLARPVARDAARVLDRLGSSSASVRSRLSRLPGSTGLESFRVEQVIWGAAGLLLALLLAIPLTLSRGLAPLPVAVLVSLGAVAGALARDWLLTRRVRAHEQRVAVELPSVAELLALAVGAGESPAAALDRVARTTQGALAVELERTLADVRAGTPIQLALQGLADRSNLPAVARFADGVAIAIERGSPLAEVLRAQAADARESARRELMEAGGRREIAMLTPVVFLILPLTVAFALFPGLSLLQLTTP